MNHAFGLRWTAREDATIRSRYLRDGARKLAACLEGRTFTAVQKRAGRLGIIRYRLWTSDEDAKLCMWWGVLTTRQMGRRFRRTADAVYVRATILGVIAAERLDKEDLTSAAKRTGYHRTQLRGILDRAGVLARATSRCLVRYKLRPKYLLEPMDVDEAVRDHLARETAGEAARRRGVDDETMRRALRRIGALKAPVPGKRPKVTFDDATIERALATTRRSPSRIDDETVSRALKAA